MEIKHKCTNGTRLAISTKNNRITIIELARSIADRSITVFENGAHPIAALSLAHNGRCLLVCIEQVVYIYDLAVAELLWPVTYDVVVYVFIFPGGTLLRWSPSLSSPATTCITVNMMQMDASINGAAVFPSNLVALTMSNGQLAQFELVFPAVTSTDSKGGKTRPGSPSKRSKACVIL
jgi:hypothetical protein